MSEKSNWNRRSDGQGRLPIILTFQVKYWFRSLIFCRDGFEVRAGQKFVKERTSFNKSPGQLFAKFCPFALIVIVEHFRF